MAVPCLRCGYDLRGCLDAAACPECGGAVGWSVTRLCGSLEAFGLALDRLRPIRRVPLTKIALTTGVRVDALYLVLAAVRKAQRRGGGEMHTLPASRCVEPSRLVDQVYGLAHDACGDAMLGLLTSLRLDQPGHIARAVEALRSGNQLLDRDIRPSDEYPRLLWAQEWLENVRRLVVAFRFSRRRVTRWTLLPLAKRVWSIRDLDVPRHRRAAVREGCRDALAQVPELQRRAGASRITPHRPGPRPGE